MEKNIKNIRNEFKKHGIFYTTNELAETLKEYVDFMPQKIYDPTCGQGNLLSVFDDDIEKYGQELFPEELEKANERLKNFHGACGDTLDKDEFAEIKFDLIVANPPFSIRWEPKENDERFAKAPCIPTAGKADYAFMLHILYHLADKGKAICLEFPGVLYRGQREGKIRKWMVEQNYIERVVHIPGNTFVDTTIATCIIIFNKNKSNTDIVFEDREIGEEISIPIEQVIDNNFALSVNLYITKEEEKEKIDPIALEKLSRNQFLERLEKELQFEKQVCEMEHISIMPFIESIEQILDKYKERGYLSWQ